MGIAAIVGRVFGVALALASTSSLVLGQEDTRDAIIEKLIQRVEALEREVAALKPAGPTAQNPGQPEPAAITQPTQENSAYNDAASADSGTQRISFHGRETDRLQPAFMRAPLQVAFTF